MIHEGLTPCKFPRTSPPAPVCNFLSLAAEPSGPLTSRVIEPSSFSAMSRKVKSGQQTRSFSRTAAGSATSPGLWANTPRSHLSAGSGLLQRSKDRLDRRRAERICGNGGLLPGVVHAYVLVHSVHEDGR